MRFIAVDSFSGYTIAIPITSKKVLTLLQALDQTIIHPFGSPTIGIRLDNESALATTRAETWAAIHNTHFIRTSPNYPHTNSCAEIRVGHIKQLLRKNIVNQDPRYWVAWLPHLSHSLNTSPFRNNLPPEKIMFGCLTQQPYHLICKESSDEKDLQQVFNDAWNKTRESRPHTDHKRSPRQHCKKLSKSATQFWSELYITT